MNTKTNLRNLLADGKTKPVIEQLTTLTQFDRDLHDQALALSARYQKQLHERHGRTGTLDDLDLELNRINAAALDLIERLPENARQFTSKWSWEKIALWIGIFAAIAAITGYTMKDFFQCNRPPDPIVQPPPAQKETDTITVLDPSGPTVKTPPTTSASKNNVKVEVKDQGKVGNIITGDSNKIDIKQDF